MEGNNKFLYMDETSVPYNMEILEDDEEGGFSVRFPDLPGCFSCGATREEAVANSINAKRCWFRAWLGDGMI